MYLYIHIHVNVYISGCCLSWCSVMSDSLQTNGLQHCRLPFPSTSPEACSNSCPSSQWCHPTIFSSCLQSFPLSRSLLMTWPYTLGGQSAGASASASVLPKNIQDWFPLGSTGLISLKSKGLFKSLLQNNSSKASILWLSAFFMVQLSHPYMTTGKTIALIKWLLVSKLMSLLLNIPSRFVIVSLPRSKHLLNLWLQSPSAVIWEPKKVKSVIVSPSICYELTRLDAMILVFSNVEI